MAESLRPGGRLIFADEGLPQPFVLRLAATVLRVTFGVIAFALVEQVTPTRQHDWRAVLEEAGRVIEEEHSFQGGALKLVNAERRTALPPLRRAIRPHVLRTG
jgi:hypothetical protein